MLRLHNALKIEHIQDGVWVLRYHRAEIGALLAEVVEFVNKPSITVAIEIDL
ncbi:hypothetical protein [Roseinatronobacter thiooxidans]|uniref:hypothetical protein n=1 Tax=Roseinatronobacter thiooxidans TaxID=121821 RepID=UPI001474DAD9|nr:hypothetical protein [Roseinatronobacter thiooxidans]